MGAWAGELAPPGAVGVGLANFSKRLSPGHGGAGVGALADNRPADRHRSQTPGDGPPRDALGAPPRSGRHRKPVGQNGPPFCPTGRVTRSATSYGLMAGVEGVPATTADGLLPYTASTLSVYSVFSLSPDTTALTS